MDGFHTVAGGGSQRSPLARPRVKVISVARMTFRLIIHDDVVSLCSRLPRSRGLLQLEMQWLPGVRGHDCP